MIIRKAFKYRIYPDSEQQAELAIQFGCVRFVYNHYRAVREGYYIDTGTGLNYNDCAADLTDYLKVEFSWLKTADSQALQQALKDLDRAYQNFFEGRAEYPNFKRKFDGQSIRYPQRFKFNGNKIYLPKVGWVKVIRHRRIEGKMKNCTVSKTKSGKYFVSIQCEMEVDDPKPVNDKGVGIDLGIKTFAVLSEGPPVETPSYLRKSERLIKIRQRRLSRRVKGSRSREDARHRLAVIHEKVANQRRDFHHKASADIVANFGAIGIEDLNIRGMLRNHHLAKSIADAGWGQFRQFLAYKAAWAGGTIVKHDRWFASSKTCHVCGEHNKSLKLSDRVWVCLRCNVVHDRDHNAAMNLKPSTAGAAESNAGGDMSSAVRHSAPEKSQAECLKPKCLSLG